VHCIDGLSKVVIRESSSSFLIDTNVVLGLDLC
jgi:hypothetical protein